MRDLVTHTWDLAEAAAHPHGRDPELAESALTTARRVRPGPRRAPGTPFTRAIETPEDAGPRTRLAARPGRIPLSRA
ncbi:hypothetical protein ABZX30_29195 [Streptomyces sp. NPDC004542]|uniref:hypothetical protein n=1 Tax=Streptomyces sp. NPDC004542 TaxID=3154281 RepID=UPI0033BD240A